MDNVIVLNAKKPIVTTDSYNGGCPYCGKCYHVDIGQMLYGVCHEHKVKWQVEWSCILEVSSNNTLVRSPDNESLYPLNQAAAALLSTYREVEPILPVPKPVPPPPPRKGRGKVRRHVGFCNYPDGVVPTLWDDFVDYELSLREWPF